MNISYDAFTEDFLAKINEYDFVNMDIYVSEDIIGGYLKRSITQFDQMCQKGIIKLRDNDQRLVDLNIDESDVYEVINIVSEGMVVQWLKAYLYNQEILEQSVNTNDFSVYSPAELLKRVRETYQSANKEHLQMMREYTYNHSDLSELHI